MVRGAGERLGVGVVRMGARNMVFPPWEAEVTRRGKTQSICWCLRTLSLSAVTPPPPPNLGQGPTQDEVTCLVHLATCWISTVPWGEHCSAAVSVLSGDLTQTQGCGENEVQLFLSLPE